MTCRCGESSARPKRGSLTEIAVVTPRREPIRVMERGQGFEIDGLGRRPVRHVNLHCVPFQDPRGFEISLTDSKGPAVAPTTYFCTHASAHCTHIYGCNGCLGPRGAFRLRGRIFVSRDLFEQGVRTLPPFGSLSGGRWVRPVLFRAVHVVKRSRNTQSATKAAR